MGSVVYWTAVVRITCTHVHPGTQGVCVRAGKRTTVLGVLGIKGY